MQDELESLLTFMVAIEPPSVLAPLLEELTLPSFASALSEVPVLPPLRWAFPELLALPPSRVGVPALLPLGLGLAPLAPPDPALPAVAGNAPLLPLEDEKFTGLPVPPSMDASPPPLLPAAPLLLPPGASIAELSAVPHPSPVGRIPITVSESRSHAL